MKDKDLGSTQYCDFLSVCLGIKVIFAGSGSAEDQVIAAGSRSAEDQVTTAGFGCTACNTGRKIPNN